MKMESDLKYSIYKQITLLFLTIVLLILYWNKVFKNEDYNTLCLIYAIVIFLWNITVMVRFIYLSSYPQAEIKDPIFKVPCGLKCYFGEPGCEGGDFTVFSIIHLVMYIIIGWIVPGLYIEVFFTSVACEFLEAGIGFQTKFILDPIVNMIGYIIGTQLKYLYNYINGN
jgi:hypothetical protein